jgi:hypothetical protein
VITDPPFYVYHGSDDLYGPQQNGEVPCQASKGAGWLPCFVVEDLKSQDAFGYALAEEKILIEVQGESENIIKTELE